MHAYLSLKFAPTLTKFACTTPNAQTKENVTTENEFVRGCIFEQTINHTFLQADHDQHYHEWPKYHLSPNIAS